MWRTPLPAANDSEYGLNASIWTRDLPRGCEIARRIRCGTVNVNEAYVATWATHTPMGGMRNSGIGRRHGEEGLTKYTEAQTIGVAPYTPLFFRRSGWIWESPPGSCLCSCV